MSELQRLLSRAFERAVSDMLESVERSDGGDERFVSEQVGGGTYRISALLQPRLDLGLRIDGEVAQGILRRGAHTGDREFDRCFRVVADEDTRATKLVSPALREGLLAARGREVEVVIEDAAVLAGHPSEQAARQVAEGVATLVDAARAKVPCATMLSDHRTVLASFAARNGLALESTPLRLAGQVDGLTLHLTTARTGFDEHTATVVVSLPTPLRLGLVLVREGSGAAALSRAKGAVLGPTGRDDLRGLFAGRTLDPDALGRLVDAGVAEALLRCALVARDVAVSDAEVLVELRCTADAPDEPLEVLRAAMAVARRLDDNVRQARARAGPYR